MLKTIAVVIGVLILVGWIFGGGDDEEPSAATTDESSESTTDEETEAVEEEPAEEEPTEEEPLEPASPKDALRTDIEAEDIDVTKVKLNGKTATVVFKISDNLTNGLIQTGAKNDTLAIVGAAQEINVKRLTVHGTFPMMDKYGNDLGQVRVMEASYSPEDMKKINADNILVREDIWALASNGSFLHPAFNE